MGSKSDDSINIAHHELKTYSSESTSSGSTISERNNACQQDTTATKHAVILDIDPHTRTPRDGMVFRKPSVEELLRRGPAKVMAEAKQHSTKVRWVHLRSNVMWWVEELMDRVCEERRIRITDHESDRPGTPTHNNPLLRKDLWYHLFHGKASDQIQTRFLGPACIPFSIDIDDEQSDSAGNGSPKGPRDNLALYLPYLQWESVHSWHNRQTLVANVERNVPCPSQADSEFIKEYMHHKSSPLHDRRTLHQAYYHDFGMTQSLPTYTQVMERFTTKTSTAAEAKLIVVDQLWLWVIKGVGLSNQESGETNMPDLVISCFPGRFNGEYDSADIYHGIIEHLERGMEPPLRGANDLVSVIVEHCTGVFFQRQLEADKWFLEFFAAAIGEVRQSGKEAFHRFVQASSKLDYLQSQQASLVEISRKLEGPDFSIATETALVSDVKDIIDELACIDYILARQDDVANSLTRNNKSRSLKSVNEIMHERRNAWRAVADTAQLAYTEIQAQMDLKQKQSSLAEARSNRYQAEAQARNGRIMLLFTVVTIVFLPMSFLATWFGMNLTDKPHGQLSLGLIAVVVFPVSIILAVIALLYAFSERLRDRTAGIIEAVLDGVMSCMHIHGSSSARRRRRSQLRDRRGPARWDVRLRRLTEPDMEAQRDGEDGHGD